MENKHIMCQIETKPEFTGITKKCKCCDKDLPLTHFKKRGTGYRNICIECEKREAGATDKFKDFTSRELIDELRSRGYEGQLTKKVVETIKL